MNGTIQYSIRPYDTIWMLAQVFNTTVDSIMELNPGINPRYLLIGQVIAIRPGFQQGQTTLGDYNHTGETDNGNNQNEMNDPNGMNGTNGINTPNGMNIPNVFENLEDMEMDMSTDMDEEDLVNYFRMLWEQHIVWTRMVVMGIIHDLPETEQMIQRLLRNPSDFAQVFAEFYGEEAAQEFEQLFTQHLTIAAELVKAAKAGDNNTVADANQRWHENAEEIAALLASLNPYWSEDDWSAMLFEHLALLSDNVADMLEGNFEQSINGYDDIERQALEMAEIMAEGIAMQFPD